MIEFKDFPLLFILLILIPVVIFLYFRKTKRAGVRFSSTKNASRVKKSLRQRLIILPLVLQIIAVIFIIAALARPRQGLEQVKNVSRGIAIQMVVDRSGSMRMKKDSGRKTVNRLDVVKEAFTEFVSGQSGKLPGRPNDLIGLITFAKYADTVASLTRDRSALLSFINSVKIVQIDSENATSIGDAIALAAARLEEEEEYLQNEEYISEGYEIKSKIIILLTDGEDTGTGKRTPMEATEIAKEWGIKVYTIGLGGEGWYDIREDPFFGTRKISAPNTVDTVLLKKIAEETGGLFRVAEDIKSLMDVYKEIDQMEKSEITTEIYSKYKEHYIPFAITGLIFLILGFALDATLFRRIP